MYEKWSIRQDEMAVRNERNVVVAWQRKKRKQEEYSKENQESNIDKENQ